MGGSHGSSTRVLRHAVGCRRAVLDLDLKQSLSRMGGRRMQPPKRFLRSVPCEGGWLGCKCPPTFSSVLLLSLSRASLLSLCTLFSLCVS